MKNCNVLSWLTVWSSMTAVGSAHISPRQSNDQSSIIPPSQDPFYQPAPGFESTTPGTILDSRQLSAGLDGSSTTWQLLYRSTDSTGDPNAIVTTILVPEVGDPKKLLIALDPFDAAAVDCAPSYALQQKGNQSSDPIVGQALAAGWYITVPDYESFNASFGNGVQLGQASLDSIRSALASTDITGIASDATYVVSGYSQGAIAGEFAMELAPDYAPELCIAGVAIGGITPNVTNTSLNVNGRPQAGLIPVGIFGLTAQNATARAAIESKLIPANAAKFDAAATQCSEQYGPAFAGEDIFTTYFTEGAALVSDPVLQPLVDQFGVMGTRGTPKVPIFAYKGVLDEISNITVTDALIDQYCADGARIHYIRNSAADHELDGNLVSMGAFAWLSDRMNGVPVLDGCSTTTW